jgi:trehalose 6-phosphate phosphatase
MKDILARGQREILRQFAWSNVLVALDYDGTLAPIVHHPGRAVMRESTRRLLAELASRYPCIVVSGRSQTDVRRRLRGIPLRAIIGNHGIEPWRATRRLVEELRRWEPLLFERLSRLPGVWVENKTFSVAVHYRGSREKKKARAAILEAAAKLGRIRVIGGKQVVNLLPEGAPHKGMALERERERVGCDTAIYVGDDETDEDVFGLDQPGRLLSIRVGHSRSSQASYYLRSQAAIDELLARLVGLRRGQELRRALSS